jgi:hypothetical protein
MFDPVSDIVFRSAASSHKAQSGIVRGSKPDETLEVVDTTNAIASYKRRIVLEVTPEIASVVAFAGAIVNGLVNERVFVRVMLR